MIFDSTKLKNALPNELHLRTSNGKFLLNKSDCTIAPPQYFITYHHSTPEVTGDVLTDGEPDYLGFDIQVIESPKKCKCDITYGDAMMFSFDLLPNGEIKVGHYNGYGSKFDPKYEFFFKEETIKDLMDLFTNITGFSCRRDQFNFLDGNKTSFKMEKVNHHKIIDFRSFNRLNRL